MTPTQLMTTFKCHVVLDHDNLVIGDINTFGITGVQVESHPMGLARSIIKLQAIHVVYPASAPPYG